MSGVPKMARVNISSQCNDADFGINCRASIGAWDSISTIAPCGAMDATIWSQLRAVVLVEKT